MTEDLEDPGTVLGGGRGSGGHIPKARLRDGIVLRESGTWTPAVLALLRHLEDVGFMAAPRVVGPGISPDGRETLSFVPGESPHPGPWSEEAAREVGQILASLHLATASFRPPPDPAWRLSFARELPGRDRVIGHGDAGPWNWIASNGRPVGLIDWEYAGPVGRLWELAEVAWLNAQLHDDDVAEQNGLPGAFIRAHQARAILDGYGLASRLRRGFVDRMIEFAVRSARAEAVEYGVQPRTVQAVSSSGYPFLWGITWRARSAAWMLSNRRLLETVVE